MDMLCVEYFVFVYIFAHNEGGIDTSFVPGVIVGPLILSSR